MCLHRFILNNYVSGWWWYATVVTKPVTAMNKNAYVGCM